MNKSMIQMSEIAAECWATFNECVDNGVIKEGCHETLRTTLSKVKIEISRLREVENSQGASWDLDKEISNSWTLLRRIENAFIKALYN